MRDLRIVFMGTPLFAVEILKELVENNYNIVGVITAPDKPAGRGRKLHQSAVKEYALEKELSILQPTNLKDEVFLEQLKKWNANLQIVVAFRMLPRAVWEMPEFGTFNLHASLLPQYRGAAPINWAIINGEKKTGVTTFFIDDKIDTGAIILQEELSIQDDETAGSLHNRLMKIGSKTVLDTVDLIKNDNVTTYLQTEKEQEKLKTANKIYKETCKVDWSQNTDNIYNHIRGLSPYPTAWTTLVNGEDELTIKIFEVSKEKTEHNHESGLVVSGKKNVKVAVIDGYIHLIIVQLAGKKKMSIKDLLNGFELKNNTKMR